MSSIQINAVTVESVSIRGFTVPYLDVSMEMDESQMKGAVGELFGEVSEKTMRQWVDEFASDYLEEIREESVRLGREQAEAERTDE